MSDDKKISELSTLSPVDDNDYLVVVDRSDTTMSVDGTTKKALKTEMKGDTGDAATLDVGTTTTGLPGTDASVVNSGSTSAAIFDFTIPRGEKGETGAQVESVAFVGDDMVFTLDDASTVTLDDAKVTLKGDQGIQGETGATGPTGPQGPQGEKGDTGDIDHAGDITADGVFIDSDSENNSSQFSYGYGFDPLLSEYFNKKFRIDSFLETPFFSTGVARNYLLQTERFGTTWVNTGGTLTSNDVLNPGGSLTADSITAGPDADSNILQTITNNATGYWSAGLWLRSPAGAGTVGLQINSGGTGGGETGTVKTVNIDAQWRFFAVTQELTAAHTTKTFKIIYGTTPISLWGARMNPGQTCNAYNARTTSALTTATPGIFFNNTPVYATTFTGALAGNATSAGYSQYGSYFGNTISNATDNTDKWAYFGAVTITYQSTYSYGSSYNVELLLQEMSKDGSKTAAQLETARVVLKGSLASYAGSTATFNSNIPSMAIELSGENLVLTKNDIACMVYSTSTTTKVIRFYVKLKDDNTHYNITVLNSKGASYASTGTISTSYCNFTAVASQAVITDLPAAAQGDIVYATDTTTTFNSALVTTGNITAPTIKLTTGAGAGKVLVSDADGDATWETAGAVPVKATGAELDTGTNDDKFATAKALKDSHNVPSVAPSTAGKVLRSNGTDWTSANIAAGDLPSALTPTTIELGHASDTTLSRGAAGFLAVEGKRVPSPASQAAGDILYRGGTEWERLAKGTAGQVLTMNSGATAPEWAAPTAGSSVWTAVPGTPTRTGNTTFTITGNYTALVTTGMVIKWTQSSVVKAGLVLSSTYSSPNTTVTIVGDTMASIDASSCKYFNKAADVIHFAYAGTIGAVATDVMRAWYADKAYRVLGAKPSVGTAGTTNNTTFDININGTTAFTTKPTIATTATTGTIFTADNGKSLAINDKVTIDVDAVQTTPAVDGYIDLFLLPTYYLSLT